MVGLENETSWLVGTWISIEWTLSFLIASTPGPAASGSRWNGLNGRSPARSKIEPRSTKNGSSRCPAKTLIPPGRLVTAAAASLPGGIKVFAGQQARGRCGHETVVVRSRARPDVVGWGRDVFPEHRALPLRLALLVEVDFRDAVGLGPVPARVAERGDRTRVVEERVRVSRRGVEPELVAQVGLAVPVVVDLDLVEDGVVEAVEVRPAGRSFERDVVRDHRDRVRA